MMKAVLLSAMVFGPCLGAVDRSRLAEDLEAGPEDAPQEATPPPSNPPSAGAQPGTQVQMTLSGNPSDYASTYWDQTFFPAIKVAINNQDVQFNLNSVVDGSVIVLFTLFAANLPLATLQGLAAEIVRQANDPNSPLRTGTLSNTVLGAVLANPVVPYIPVPTNDDDGLSDGAIAGIVVGTIVGVALIVVVVYFVACKGEERTGGPPPAAPDAPYGDGQDEEVEMEAVAGEEKPHKGDEEV